MGSTRQKVARRLCTAKDFATSTGTEGRDKRGAVDLEQVASPPSKYCQLNFF